MSRADLSESQLIALSKWAETLGSLPFEREKGQQIMAVVAELRRLRENESNTRWLSQIEGEV